MRCAREEEEREAKRVEKQQEEEQQRSRRIDSGERGDVRSSDGYRIGAVVK